MFLSPRFYYEDDTADKGAGGGSNQTDTKVETIFSTDDLKGMGFDSTDQLKEFVRAQKEQAIPAEEKEKKANVEKANLLKYATENSLMNVEDYNKLENLKAKPDKDLVFEKFSQEYKEDFSDATEDDVKEAFEKEYRLTSDNDKAKTRGESRLKKEADELRSPYEKKFTTAESEYKADQKLRGQYPAYNTLMDGLIKELTPDKLVLFKAKDGETEIDIDIDLTKEDREEIAKTFKNEKTFYKFIKNDGKIEDLKPSLEKKIKSFMKDKYFEKVNEKTFEVAKGIGTKSGSNVGAESLYSQQKNDKGDKGAKVIDLEESNRKIHEARERIKGNR